MAKPVIMPRFGMTQEEADIVRWLRADGERVEQGDPICEVTTDKVNMEVEAPASGILAGICFKEGDTVAVTTIIAYIVNEQEYQTQSYAAGQQAKPETTPQPGTQPTADIPVSATPLAQRIAAAEGISLAGLQGSGAGGKIVREDVRRALDRREAEAAPAIQPGKVPASPAARSLAAQHGIALAEVAGSGPQGRVQGWDVQKHRQELLEARPIAAPPSPEAAPPDVEILPLQGMRKTIANRVQASYQQAPHIYLTMEICMDRAIALRAALNPRLPAGREAVSITALIVKACALALRAQPMLNSHFIEDKMHRYQQVNIGMAVALDDGLIVPVIHSADRLGLNQLGDLVGELSRRARQGKLRPEDVSGGIFTISNLGMFGIDQFTAILNPPQVGILAVGRVARRFVPDEQDRPVARSMMNVSLSADHRVVDGLAAARFLSALRDGLENPNLLLE